MHLFDSSTHDFLLLVVVIDDVIPNHSHRQSRWFMRILVERVSPTSLASTEPAVRAFFCLMHITDFTFFLSVMHKPIGYTHDFLLLVDVIDAAIF